MHRPEWAGIVLAGAPGAGKRTTAFALGALGDRYVRFPALTTGRDVALDTERVPRGRITELRSWAQVFHEVVRDGAVLVHDHERLGRIRESGRLPVVTVDAVASLDAFARESTRWLPVLLRCPYDAGRSRLPRRQWARGYRELERAQDRFALAVRTDRLPVMVVAHLIHTVAQVGADSL
ncbi:hypothetical protein [Pseudonocardia acaciae]|uniref:hypothetical protein n=1 Tax=Pseudonocardia acaciae TaxID=551276 RepID=UPI00048D2E55|nr:hypothetical protein [Pseudonocardia acaciae]